MAESISTTATLVAPALVGTWVFDPTGPDATEQNYPYSIGRGQSIKPASAQLVVAGRTYPIAEFGENESETLSVPIIIPFGDGHDAQVKWWRDATRARRTLCYRDNRGRLVYGVLLDGLEVNDAVAGTNMTIKLTRVDYSVTVS
jgi:hypothetical protein